MKDIYYYLIAVAGLSLALLPAYQAWLGYLNWVSTYSNIPSLYLPQSAKLAYFYAVGVPSATGMALIMFSTVGLILIKMADIRNDWDDIPAS